MSLILKGTTNDKNNLYLNNIVLIDKDGNETTIDRDNTEWGAHGEFTKYDIYMKWGLPYTWDSEKEGKNWDYSHISINKAFQNAVDFRIEIEDDAPEQYKLDITEVYYEYEIPVKSMGEIANVTTKAIERNTGIDISNDINFQVLHLFSKMRQDLISTYKVLNKKEEEE